MAQLNAFIARSFAPQDEQRIRPILEFLDTFRRAGFICEEAEAAEVESVSAKVQRMIGEKDVFIGFFTKRHPVYRFESRFKGVFQILFGSAEPEIWSAPAWVLQESGYALRAGKDLILLRESGVEMFGLQGDLEYIPFDSKNPAEVYGKLSQMVNDLLAKRAGTEVKVVVTERPEQREVAVEQAVSEPKIEEPKAGTEEPDIIEHYFEMGEAVEKQDFQALDAAWQSGKELITAGKIKDFEMVAWDCLYFEKRFEMGAPDALENLRRLKAENPERPAPASAMARCLFASQEFEEAGQLYLATAALQKDKHAKAHSLVSAAKAFREAKQYNLGHETITKALTIATGDLHDEAIGLQYQLLRFIGKEYFAFAIAESSLHENPLLPIRFGLALDYHRKDINELGLSHFKFLHERNRKDPSSLHNLALLYSDCKLPVASVEHYKLAFSMGETLSAANLGFMYLDAGMADEAKVLLEQAMKVEVHEARVEKCLAEIHQRKEVEKEKETELLEKSAATKSFLVNLGRALSAAAPPVNGYWKFPFGKMPLTLDSNRITGTVEISKEVSGFGALFGTPGQKIIRTDRYSLEGTMTGSVCEFELTIADVSGDLTVPIGLSSLAGPKSGFIVFAAEGQSAIYAELSGGKLGSSERLSKVG